MTIVAYVFAFIVCYIFFGWLHNFVREIRKEYHNDMAEKDKELFEHWDELSPEERQELQERSRRRARKSRDW